MDPLLCNTLWLKNLILLFLHMLLRLEPSLLRVDAINQFVHFSYNLNNSVYHNCDFIL